MKRRVKDGFGGNDCTLEEEVLVVDESFFGDSEEHAYDMKCYDGYAIGQRCDNWGEDVPETIKMTYPKISELSEDEIDEALRYRGLGGQPYNYGDIMMRYGKVVGSVSDSRRVKDNVDEYGDYETEVAVYINGADNLSNEEANVLTDALKELVDYNRYNSNEGSWCEAYEFETLDRVGEGESVGVWGNAAGDSYDTIYNAFYSWTEQWAIDNGYDIEVQLFDAD